MLPPLNGLADGHAADADDGVGNRLSETKNGITDHYCYQAQTADCATHQPAGNRLYSIHSASRTGPLYRQFLYADSGRITEKRDGAGALIYQLAHDARGRVSSLHTPSAATDYRYDNADYRIRKSGDGGISDYLREGEHLEAIYQDGDLKWEYLRGVVVDEIVNAYDHQDPSDPNDWINYSFHHDHLRSVTALTGHTGAIEETTRYDAFGAPLNLTTPGTGNDLLYTGREYDRDTGLYYYRARYYDPEIGRFLSKRSLD